MTSRAVMLAAEAQRLLQERGYTVSRHASSMLVLYAGKLAATIHVYPDLCRLNIYQPWSGLLAEKQAEIRRLLEGLCGRVEEAAAPRYPSEG